MSSTIVTGVSEKLGFEYLKSYIDKSTSESRFIVDDNNDQIRRFFRTASDASAFISDYSHIYKSSVYSNFDIYLNRYNREIQIKLKELHAFCELEEDSDLYRVFTAYADKISNTIDLEDEQEPDEHQELYEEYVSEKKHKVQDEDIIDLLRNEIAELQIDWCESEIKLNRQLRDLAMEFIYYMEPTDFENRLLSGKLPKFPRSLPGYDDYREISTKPDIFKFPKRRLTSRDIDSNIFNFAYAKREYLRYMSEEDFKKLCYTDIA